MVMKVVVVVVVIVSDEVRSGKGSKGKLQWKKDKRKRKKRKRRRKSSAWRMSKDRKEGEMVLLAGDVKQRLMELFTGRVTGWSSASRTEHVRV